MGTALRAVWAALTLPAWYLARLLLTELPGLLLVPVAIATGKWKTSRTLPRRAIYTAPWPLWLWGNDEDGYDPQWYAASRPNWPRFMRRWMWAAVRNPANNQRFIKALHPAPVPSRVKFAQVGNWTIGGQGLFSRVVYARGDYEYSIGWKYRPDDVNGIHPDDHRLFGCGFGVKRKKIK